MAKHRLRTIRGQLIASLVLFELLALAFFAAVLINEVNHESAQRLVRRLEYQTSELSVVASLALRDSNMEMLHTVVNSMLQFPTIDSVNVTDAGGTTIAATDARNNGSLALSPWERANLPEVHSLRVLTRPDGRHVSAMPVLVRGQVVAYIWIHPNESASRANLREILRVSALGVFAVLVACTLLAAAIAGSLTRPLQRLLQATRRLVANPEDFSAFPLTVRNSNEAADLTIAFNLLVASIEQERRSLGDTLALLDSMLANAPLGLAFFDRSGRFVRVNQYLAMSAGRDLEHYLGRRVDEVFPPGAALALNRTIDRIFDEGISIQGLEVSASPIDYPAQDFHGIRSASSQASHHSAGKGTSVDHTWLVNAYPVRTANQAVRWVGVVFTDITERLRTEHALRQTEKLAVTGRLSASIAHEINNPLEAVTNLLYLLDAHGNLGQEAAAWAQAAQHEVARVAEITQQTLRFYRQSSRQELASLSELLDAVLTLYQGRIATLQVTVERRYRDAGELFCSSGELRQLFANLVGNALDAMQPGGGRLILSVRAGHTWTHSAAGPSLQPGVRVTVADTGCGMSPEVQERIFEPFFTTKEATGTGLGLWVSAGILTKHQAALRIRTRQPAGQGSRRPGGSVFRLFFPAASAPVLEPLPGVPPAIEARSLAR